ncbi:MAG: hypothetical protein Q9163_004720 [Psora crenata]
MARKRKRVDTHDGNSILCQPSKCAKDRNGEDAVSAPVQHPTLGLYYSDISTLRAYLHSRLPKTSRSRRRRFASAGSNARTVQLPDELDIAAQDITKSSSTPCSPTDNGNSLGKVLDWTLVCRNPVPATRPIQPPLRDYKVFSQHKGSTADSSLGQGTSSQSDLVDFAIWLLFHRVYRNTHRPPHMLCYGYQRATNPIRPNEDYCAVAGIPGIVSHYPNSNVNVLKGAVWAEILALLGKDGEEIMLDALLGASIFAIIPGCRDNYYQLSGTPLTDLQPLSSVPQIEQQSSMTDFAKFHPRQRSIAGKPSVLNSPSAITFVRSRMLYARPALNAKGKVTFGLRHIHALNRYSDYESLHQTSRLMKYIFPKQFSLHNVFTSKVDYKETVQPLKDYTLREEEIAQQEHRLKSRLPFLQDLEQRIPRRLRGEPVKLVRELQRRHSRCSYSEILEYHCPKGSNSSATKPNVSGHCRPSKRSRHERSIAAQNSADSSLPATRSAHTVNHAVPPLMGCDTLVSTGGASSSFLVDLATPEAQVSAFCRATLSNLIPDGFWGQGEARQQNKAIIMRDIDRFVRLRRFESMSLHTVYQRLKLGYISWLTPPSTTRKKTALSDMKKRQEIFLEFLYYVFDSLLIPLIRSNFHVTESNVHQNRLFYFRQDVWRALTEPAMTNLKLSIFEEVPVSKAKKMLDARLPGFSQIRLVPKADGLRPITNLRRRVTKLQNGKIALGRSINSVMAPVFSVLDLEKKQQPDRLGNALFSVGDIYPKLRMFRNRLKATGAECHPLYFAKCDAKSCFDTIPQGKVVKLVEQIPSDDAYRIARHAEIKSIKTYLCRKNHNQSTYNPARRYISVARSAADFLEFDKFIAHGRAVGKRYTIFVDSIVQQNHNKEKLLDLLEQHVQSNLVKIGKKFFRQKAGIPQGSVLSSLLCTFFYAELEKEYFGFLDDDESILLRLIDDFLLITTNKEHAKRFMQIMHDGVDKYGVHVNLAKSLTNFTMATNGLQVPQWPNPILFPYCGNIINTVTLEITKDRERRKGTTLADTLTVELSKTPGRIFYRKAVNAFKIQMHKMLFDTNFNSLTTVLSTIYQSFTVTAMKYYRYVKSMTSGAKPHSDLLISEFRGTSSPIFLRTTCLGYTMPQHLRQPRTDAGATHTAVRNSDYHCAVSKRQVTWLASKAFRHVLGRKQSRYGEVLIWLDITIDQAMPDSGKELLKLNRIARRGGGVFREYKY